MKATRLGSGETAAHAADGTGSYPKDRLMLTDSPQYPHRCFTDEGDWVSCPPELCEADFLLREKQAAEAELAEAREKSGWQKQYDRANAAETALARLRAVLAVVDEALADGDASSTLISWHHKHVESSAEDCLICVVRAALADKEEGA